VERVNDEVNFADTGKLSLEKLFEIQGTIKLPVLIFEKDGIIEVQSIDTSVEEDVEKLHVRVLHTIAELIRKIDPPELFVGYEGFYLMQEAEKAVRVLVGILYADDVEQVWLAQTHGREVGEWQDVSDNPNRFGFEGLWQNAKAYARN